MAAVAYADEGLVALVNHRHALAAARAAGAVQQRTSIHTSSCQLWTVVSAGHRTLHHRHMTRPLWPKQRMW